MERRSYFGGELLKYKNDQYLNKSRVEEVSSIGLSSWPPKCYTCSFCKRQFRSAQALGGHMNIHRRDRARLKSQLPCTTNPNNNSSPPPQTSPVPSSSISPFAKWSPCKKPSYNEDEELMKMKSMRTIVVGFGEFKGFVKPKCVLDHQVLTTETNELMSLDLEMGFKDPEEILDLELRLG